MALAYTCFVTDFIHEGHLNIINEATKYGEVIVGVLADEEMVKYDSYPISTTEERVRRVQELEGVSKVVVQRNMMYTDIIEEYHPDFIVHGDNWCTGHLSIVRDAVARQLVSYGGRIIDTPYSFNPEISKAEARRKQRTAMPEIRRARLKRLIGLRPVVKALEVHSGITGLIAEKTVTQTKTGELDQFDAMWISSLCDSTAKGKPDIELVDITSRFRTIEDVMEVTSKPIIFDGDTGGLIEHFVYTVRSLERMGVSAIIIEDKTGLKKNSLFGTEVEQTQDSIEHFCKKIAAGKKVQLTDDFMIIARIESLILEKGQEDALERAKAYVEAGADAIMIHSRKSDPSEILEFCDTFRANDKDTPIVVVPTSFNSVYEEEFAEHGVNIVIYANQLTRSAFPAMQQTAVDILHHHRAKEVDDRLMSIKSIISLVDEMEF